MDATPSPTAPRITSAAIELDRVVKTKIIATVGPAIAFREKLRELVLAGVDIFRLNFAHGEYSWFQQMVTHIRGISDELSQPVGILADLSGPKIRLGILPEAGVRCRHGAKVCFVRATAGTTVPAETPEGTIQFTCTYEQLIDDLRPGDRVLLADGIVTLRVTEQDSIAGRVTCVVEQPGLVRSRQGINLPGVKLSTPSLTEKDRADLAFVLTQEVDYVGLSFVRSSADIRLLREAITAHAPKTVPMIVAKIEKTEALSDLDAIVAETDAVMVARGDLGVEADITMVPVLQKRIIRLCNERRIPVITATQMLDSMQKNELPTRAEANDVANAVLDGTDAVMLSGETAVGDYPVEAVRMMNQILANTEPLLSIRPLNDEGSLARARATVITEAVTIGAGTAASHLGADLIVVATHNGKTAMALSKQRRPTPILAISDQASVARRMALYWGVVPVLMRAISDPQALLVQIEQLGRERKLLTTGSKLVIVGRTRREQLWQDMMLVHIVGHEATPE